MSTHGQGFIDYVTSSPLGVALRNLGLIQISEVNVEEKDYGDGAVAYFDVGFVYYTLPVKRTEGFHTDDQFGRDPHDIQIYHSRFTDTWYNEIRGERFENWGLPLNAMEDPAIVARCIRAVKDRLNIE